jgi:hypothetical protein
MSLRGQLPQLGDLGVQTVAPGKKKKKEEAYFMYNAFKAWVLPPRSLTRNQCCGAGSGSRMIRKLIASRIRIRKLTASRIRTRK